MEHIVEHYGTGFLQLISGVLLIALYFSFLNPGGVLSDIVGCYINGICG